MKMYFYYGAMGSSKTATALMRKFNFEEHGRTVAIIKPAIDTRDGNGILKSRMGLSCKVLSILPNQAVKNIIDINFYEIFIIDEAQFLSTNQVEELRELADLGKVVMCYGLKSDYTGRLFEGSKRLLELSDSIREIQSMCPCGRKAIINARYKDQKIIYSGPQIQIGGNDKYISLCHKCYKSGALPKRLTEPQTLQRPAGG